jgi:hypothetical protein
MELDNTYDDLEQRAFSYSEGSEDPTDGMEFVEENSYYDDFDNSLLDIDFSDFKGESFKKNFSRVAKKLKTKVIAPDGRKVIVEGKDRDLDLPKYGQRVIAPDNRRVIVEGVGKSEQRPKRRKKAIVEEPQRAIKKPLMASPTMMKARPSAIKRANKNIGQETQLSGGKKYDVKSKRPQKISKVVVPNDKKVIIEGVNNFILDQSEKTNKVKNIGYYKGKKLQELVFTFNNDSALPFELELFNPSMPLDYLYSTSLNLNDKIQVAGGEVSYTDVLFNMLANSIMIPNAKFVFAGTSVSQQKVEPIKMINKSITGEEKVYPFNLDLQVDTMQVANDIVFFDFFDTINRPFIPDGMDIMKYKVLPQMTVTMALFFDQISLKKVFRKEARKDKGLL